MPYLASAFGTSSPSDGCPIALKGLVLAEKYIDDMKRSVKNHFEAFEIEGIERGMEEFKKLAMENVENSKKELELLKKENAQLKEKAASLPKLGIRRAVRRVHKSD